MTEDDRNPDTTTGTPAAAHDQIQHYEFRVKGRLTPRWSAWFDGLIIETDAADGTTAIRGPIVDQAALHGLLQKLRDVGIPLLSLTQVPFDTTNELTAHPNQKDN